MTLPVTRQRDQRLEARLTPDQKKLIERAACVQGRTVTDFVVSALQDAARQAIAEHAIWKLTEDQRQVFIEALMNPPSPNPKLRQAYKRLQRHKRSSGR